MEWVSGLCRAGQHRVEPFPIRLQKAKRDPLLDPTRRSDSRIRPSPVASVDKGDVHTGRNATQVKPGDACWIPVKHQNRATFRCNDQRCSSSRAPDPFNLVL